MKRLMFLFIALLCLFGCNNNETKKDRYYGLERYERIGNNDYYILREHLDYGYLYEIVEVDAPNVFNASNIIKDIPKLDRYFLGGVFRIISAFEDEDKANEYFDKYKQRKGKP